MTMRMDGNSGRLLRWRIIFFFQAEDGIRDRNVTGVQTCALPIYDRLIVRRIAQRSGERSDDHALERNIARVTASGDRRVQRKHLDPRLAPEDRKSVV